MSKKEMGYWNKERCVEVALLCKSKKEMRIKYEGAYKYAYRNELLDEICSHMKIIGSLYERLVYAFKFSDKSVYVGLTCDEDRRICEHTQISRMSAVYIHISKTGIEPIFEKLTDYINIEEAIEMEKYYIDYYTEKGWNILNRTKGGGLGGGRIKWIYDSCKNEALKYSNRTSFRKGVKKAYEKCRKEGWLDEFYPPSINDRKPNKYWTKDRCIEAISLCKSKVEFVKNYSSAFWACRKNDWMKEVILQLGSNI